MLRKIHSFKALFLLASTLLVSSCATMFNPKTGSVTVRTSEAIKYIHQKDTIQSNPDSDTTFLEWSQKEPIELKILKPNGQETISIPPRLTRWYWMNGLNVVGFLVDEITQKKYRYPKKVFIHSSPTSTSYIPYFPMDSSLIQKKNKLLITTLSWIGWTHPGLEISFERLHGINRSTQFSYYHFISKPIGLADNSKGFKIGLEEKFFFRNMDKVRLYSSITLEYFYKEHDSNLSWVLDDIPQNANRDRYFEQVTTIQKRFLSITPRIGVQKYLSNRLVLDAFFGVGIRRRDTKHLNAPAFSTHIRNGGFYLPDLDYPSNKVSTRFSPNIDLNLRIGWTF